jgi:hypothetical protein
MRAQDVEDIRRYRYAAQHHSSPDLRAAAACKALAWQGKAPTVAAVAKLADVEFAIAEETVDLWHGRRPLEVTRPGAAGPVEVASWGDIVGHDKPGPPPGRIHVGGLAIQAAADLTTMAGGPLHPGRRRRRRK